MLTHARTHNRLSSPADIRADVILIAAAWMADESVPEQAPYVIPVGKSERAMQQWKNAAR